jgi:NAD(P)-dependent dehydrogenase (short-subunit alcohol dehydrogenase family)
MDISGKNIIITGATSGIGMEAALSLARRGPCLILPSRNPEKGMYIKNRIIQKTGNSNIHVMNCDLASFDSVRDFADRFRKRFGCLHILINNAGIWELGKRESDDGIELNFAVNHLGPFLLTCLLLDELRRGAPSRVINVSSRYHRWWKFDFNDPESRKFYFSIKSYGRSKLANILFTRHLAEMLREDGITVNSLHPGLVATDIFRGLPALFRTVARLFMLSPRRGARTIIYLATSPDVSDVTGEYFYREKICQPSRAARDREAAKKLWEISRKYAGLETLPGNSKGRTAMEQIKYRS